MPKLIQVLLVGLAIPAVGFIAASWIISDVNADLAKEGLPSVRVVCQLEEARSNADMRGACAEMSQIRSLKTASIYAGLLGISIPLLISLASAFAGKSRLRLAIIFPPLVLLSVLLLSVMVLAQGAILTYTAYIGESYLFGVVHYVVIAALGLGALLAGVKLILAAFSLRRRLKAQVVGKRLAPNDAPRLHGFVRSLAKKLGSKSPDHVVVGLNPNFFVTSADVVLPGHEQVLEGTTLYLSAPLARLLSADELGAVLGHELGHFRGGDTSYTIKFAPIYEGLNQALGSLTAEEGEEGIDTLATLPAASVLSYMIHAFSANERAIGRQRELVADQAGAEVSSSGHLATALVKISLYSGLWDDARAENVKRLNQGKIARNLSSVFQDLAKYDVEHDSLEELKAQILKMRISHPTDTHPPTSERLSALQVSPSDITKEMLLVPAEPAIELLDGYSEIEEELTLLEHKLMVALGLATPPEDSEHQEDHFLRVTYALAAAMVGADGRIEPKEIAIAEGIGARLVSDFDSVEFREFCKNVSELPDVESMTEILANVLENQHKQLIFRYLTAIAEADGEVSPEEQGLLDRIARTLGIPPSEPSQGNAE